MNNDFSQIPFRISVGFHGLWFGINENDQQNPSFLFLDEATNALDAINEYKIVQALNRAFEKRTVVVVAHRLSTIMNADQIVVLKEGMIAEIGNHEKLMERRGHYYDLVDKQMGVWSTNGTTKSELVPIADLN